MLSPIDLTPRCYNEKCKKELPQDQESYFCDEKCKKEYWGKNYYGSKTERMDNWIADMRKNKRMAIGVSESFFSYPTKITQS